MGKRSRQTSSGPVPDAMPDPLSSIIALLRPSTVQAKVISGSGAWSIRYERYEDPAFGLVLQGSCSFDADDVVRLELQEGDFLFLPETPAFTLASDPGLKPRLVGPTVSDVHHGEGHGPVEMRMLGGYFRFDRGNARLLLRLLPPIVHVRRTDPGADRLRHIVQLITEEADASRAGRQLILDRLVEVLLIEALRYRSAPGQATEHGMLAGLADTALARSLHAIHTDVAHAWTVEGLARIACVSRAVFAERFARIVGMPPMRYLLEWRMAIAKDLLEREQLALDEVAERVGYASASAFSTAFSRLTGLAPGAFARRPHRSPDRTP